MVDELVLIGKVTLFMTPLYIATMSTESGDTPVRNAVKFSAVAPVGTITALGAVTLVELVVKSTTTFPAGLDMLTEQLAAQPYGVAVPTQVSELRVGVDHKVRIVC